MFTIYQLLQDSALKFFHHSEQAPFASYKWNELSPITSWWMLFIYIYISWITYNSYAPWCWNMNPNICLNKISPSYVGKLHMGN